MKIFHCDHCQNLIFFENTTCVKCGHFVAFLPDRGELASLEQGPDGLWHPGGNNSSGVSYRLCRNYEVEKVCNWAVPADDPVPLCLSCRLTRVIPNLTDPSHRVAWMKLEVAKRRLVYSLLHFHLPILNKVFDPKNGLAFDFLADKVTPDAKPTSVLTGHDDGLITINIAEADDGEREKRRLQLGEPYRTLLGHFRHEVGHYYWDRLIKDSPLCQEFRKFFGDERADYAQALQRYYKDGPAADWPQRFVSAYASSHPWEDWAESWAHYLHMADTLETAEGCGLSLKPRRKDEPTLNPTLISADGQPNSFERMTQAWFSLTYVLNNLNRGLGLQDGYPFVLSVAALEKLGFIHRVIAQTFAQADTIICSQSNPAN